MTVVNWVSVLGSISIWIILLPAVVGTMFIHKLDKDSRLILIVVIAGCIPQVLRPFIIDSSLLTTLYNIYTPIEFTTYWFLFISKTASALRQRILYVMAAAFILISIYLVYHHGVSIRFLNEWVIWNNIFQLIWIGLCLLEFYYSEQTVIDLSQPFFWYLIGITCYASCTAIFYSLWYFIKENPDEQFIVLNSIHHIFNILLYLFFTMGLLRNVKLSKNQKV